MEMKDAVAIVCDKYLPITANIKMIIMLITEKVRTAPNAL